MRLAQLTFFPYALVFGTASFFGCGQATVASTQAPPKSVGATALSFDHLALMVSNLERSAEFYAEVLQLPETFDATGKAHIRWFSLGGDRQLHVIATETFEGVLGKGVHLALTTADLARVISTLTAKQIPFESWPGHAGKSNLRPDGVKQIYLQDPDGYWIEINDASTKWPTPKTP